MAVVSCRAMRGVTARHLRMRQKNLHQALLAADEHLTRQREDIAFESDLAGRRGGGHDRELFTHGRRCLAHGRHVRRAQQELESRLTGLKKRAVLQRFRFRHGSAVEIGQVQGVERLNVVASGAPDDTEMMAGAGGIQDAQVRRLVPPNEERFTAFQRMKFLRCQVEQGRIAGHRELDRGPRIAHRKLILGTLTSSLFWGGRSSRAFSGWTEALSHPR